MSKDDRFYVGALAVLICFAQVNAVLALLSGLAAMYITCVAYFRGDK